MTQPAPTRPAQPGELCTCGRQAVTVIPTDQFGDIGYCGIDGAAFRPVLPCPWCGTHEPHKEPWGDPGRCPDYRLRPKKDDEMTTPPPGLLDRIKQVVGDKQIDGISAERLAGILSGWQLPNTLETALIADATGVTVLWLLHGRDDPASPTVPIKGITLGGLRAALAKLQHLPDSTRIVLAGNPEGLNFSPAGLVHEGWYVGDDISGQVYLTENLRQGMDDPGEFPPVPVGEGAVSAVVLYPQG